MTGKSPVRSCEDIDESVLSYAEVKALATGNPHIKEKMSLDIEVAKLKMMKANFAGQKYRMEDNITVHYPKRIAALKAKVEGYRADIQTYMQNRPADKEMFSMKVGDTVYHSRKEAGTALIEMCKHVKSVYEKAGIGEYQGFKMSASYAMFATKCTIHMEGSVCHDSEASSDLFGIIQRLDNMLEAMPKELEGLQRDLDNVQRQLETAKEEVSRPFEKEQELAEKTARLAELNALLNMDESGETDLEDGGEKLQDAEDQPASDAGTEQAETAGRAENDVQKHPGNGLESGMPENYGQVSDTESTSLNVAESSPYGNSEKIGETEMQHTAGDVHSLPESVKQEPDVGIQPAEQPNPVLAGIKHSKENSAVSTGNPLQRTGRSEMPGHMEVRTSVREKLAAIRERRAREQAQAKKPEKGMRKDRAAAL